MAFPPPSQFRRRQLASQDHYETLSLADQLGASELAFRPEANLCRTVCLGPDKRTRSMACRASELEDIAPAAIFGKAPTSAQPVLRYRTGKEVPCRCTVCTGSVDLERASSRSSTTPIAQPPRRPLRKHIMGMRPQGGGAARFRLGCTL